MGRWTASRGYALTTSGSDRSGHSLTPVYILVDAVLLIEASVRTAIASHRSQCEQVPLGMPCLKISIALLQPLHVDSLIRLPVTSSFARSNSSSNSIAEFGIQVRNASNASHSRSAMTSGGDAALSFDSRWGNASNAMQREMIAAASLRAHGVRRNTAIDRGGGPRGANSQRRTSAFVAWPVGCVSGLCSQRSFGFVLGAKPFGELPQCASGRERMDRPCSSFVSILR